MKDKRTLIDIIRSRKKKWIGHVLKLLSPRGRKRAMVLDEMKEGKELYAEMKERTRHRGK